MRQPVATKWLLVINIGVFITCLLTANNGQSLVTSPLFEFGALSGLEFSEAEDLWTIFTYMFLHAGVLHITCNMIGLWFFGRVLEDHFGPLHLLGIYALGGLTGAVLWLAFNWGDGVLVGASGAVLALVFAFATMHPREKVWLFPIPMPLEARWIAVGYLAITVVLALASLESGGNAGSIAHLAHLGGMAAGFIYAAFLRRHLNIWDPLVAEAPEAEMGWDDAPATVKKTFAQSTQELEAKDYVAKVVDPVLDKVRLIGYENLSPEEKKILERAQELLGRH